VKPERRLLQDCYIGANITFADDSERRKNNAAAAAAALSFQTEKLVSTLRLFLIEEKAY
jgi:hypothetical protein